MSNPAREPVIVTAREIERLFIDQKAESAIHEAAATENPMEVVQAMAMTGAILRELQKAEAVMGTSKVLVTAQHGPASRLQSLIAAGDLGSLKLEALPAGGLEAKFDTQDWGGWATVAWAKLKNLIPHPLIIPAPQPQSLSEKGRIALLGDWGTGLYGALTIADTLRKETDPFIMMLHLGDVYYAGTKKEVSERFTALWPKRPEAIHRALNSNHEMYSGGYAYFESTLPSFGQEASMFVHQNQHWTLIGLDVAHKDHSIDDLQVAWLKKVLEQAGDRKVVLFSHHQLFSCYESQGTKLWAHAEFASILRSRRIFAWYWGHEHRCAIYQEQDAASGIWGRCIGHSGMPQSRDLTRDLPPAPGQHRADWRLAPATKDAHGALLAPASLILEGPNPLITGEEDKFTPHGYAVLTLDGPHLFEQVMDAHGAVIYEKQLA